MVIKIAAALVIVYFAVKFVAALVKAIAQQAAYEKQMKRFFPEPVSEYREAFMMECSKDMIAADPYAADLDKKIKQLDADMKALRAAKKKKEDRWSSWTVPEE